MADVARRAGVSISTVSHVLNGTRFVASSTRDAVLSAVDELGYQGMKDVTNTRNSSRAIGLVITGASNPYFGELVAGVEQEATRAGYALLLCDSHDDPKQELSAVQTLISHNVEAIVIAPTPSWEDKTLPLLRKHGRPFVLVDRLSSARCDQVGLENESVSATLVEHLIEIGHRRIGMVAGLDGLSTSIERVRGYQRALQESGIEADADLIVPGLSTVAGGRSATLRLMAMRPRPTAIFSGNNAMTIGALRALREAHCAIPHDVALIAFDDFEWAETVTPALTAIAQPFHAMGAQAVQLLLRRLADPLAPRRVVRLPAEIAHRHSCGCGIRRGPAAPAPAK